MTEKEGTTRKKGAGKQFFGCVLLSLGLLNTMLTIKGGLEPDFFNYLLMLSGILFLATGIWQARRR
ncbi:MAG: hypothetical protein ACE5GY_01805 [Thermodesulfobacteriota bacterium]